MAQWPPPSCAAISCIMSGRDGGGGRNAEVTKG